MQATTTPPPLSYNDVVLAVRTAMRDEVAHITPIFARYLMEAVPPLNSTLAAYGSGQKEKFTRSLHSMLGELKSAPTKPQPRLVHKDHLVRYITLPLLVACGLLVLLLLRCA